MVVELSSYGLSHVGLARLDLDSFGLLWGEEKQSEQRNSTHACAIILARLVRAGFTWRECAVTAAPKGGTTFVKASFSGL